MYQGKSEARKYHEKQLLDEFFLNARSFGLKPYFKGASMYVGKKKLVVLNSTKITSNFNSKKNTVFVNRHELYNEEYDKIYKCLL